jgi:hypothetical protein
MLRIPTATVLAIILVVGADWLTRERPQAKAAMDRAVATTGGDPARQLIADWGCGACHTIPAIPAPTPWSAPTAPASAGAPTSRASCRTRRRT